MKIQGNQTLDATPERVWKLLVDAEVLKRCTPGCERLELSEEDVYEAVLNVGVGAVTGRYTGRVRLQEMQPPFHLKLVVDGRGTQGFVRGTGVLDLAEAGGGTSVTYVGSVQLGGPIASIGQRVLQSSARMMVGQFFVALKAELAAVKRAERTGRAVVAPKQGIFRNFLRSVWSLVKRIFGR